MTNASIKTRAIMHSDTCVIRQGESPGSRLFECRIHHIADHALVDPIVKLTMAKWHHNESGRVSIEFIDLPVSNKTSRAFIQFPWSTIHIIDEDII